MINPDLGQTASFQYHLHLVPSRFYNLANFYEFSYTEKYLPVLEPKHEQTIIDKDSNKHTTGHTIRRRKFVLPGVYFIYDFSSFVVVKEVATTPTIDVITDLLSLVGGMLAVVKVLDWLLSKVF